MLREAIYYTRFSIALARWARQGLAPQPHELVSKTLSEREGNFLGLVKGALFDNSASPYQPLLKYAGCEFGDIEKMVRGDGVEGALGALAKAGVYLTHDEFKGKAPVERTGRQLGMVDAAALSNPTFNGVIETSSSGSRSRGTITRRSLEYQRYREAQERVLMGEHEEARRRLIVMGAILPSTGGLRRALNYGVRGNPPDRWFAVCGPLRMSGHYRLLTRMMLAELRLLGIPAISPEFLPHNDFAPVARWIARRKQEGVQCILAAGVSRGLRVAAAARDESLDIAGTVFLLGGEALTDAKRAVIEGAGCEVHARYTISELGPIGMGCRAMSGNCVHICTDTVAVISRRRIAPISGIEVDSLLFTTVLPYAATVMINVEMGDAGELGEATCDCSLKRIGFTRKLDKIYSYSKLTGQGTALMGSDILQIIEQKLPARFGGLPTDYQLVEMEGRKQTEIELRVSPRVGVTSVEAVKECFLDEVKRLYAGGSARRVWIQTEGFRVVLGEPYQTGDRGKIHALHLLGTARQRADRRVDE